MTRKRVEILKPFTYYGTEANELYAFDKEVPAIYNSDKNSYKASEDQFGDDGFINLRGQLLRGIPLDFIVDGVRYNGVEQKEWLTQDKYFGAVPEYGAGGLEGFDFSEYPFCALLAGGTDPYLYFQEGTRHNVKIVAKEIVKLTVTNDSESIGSIGVDCGTFVDGVYDIDRPHEGILDPGATFKFTVLPHYNSSLSGVILGSAYSGTGTSMSITATETVECSLYSKQITQETYSAEASIVLKGSEL